jgi:hypothetical protein
MKISTPLMTNTVGAIQYPGTPADWQNTQIESNALVGDYDGALYLGDGVTKAFDWSTYTPPVPTYGLIITPLALLNRFLPAEESAIRSAQASSTSIQGLMDRIHLAAFIDLTDPVTEGGINALVTGGLLTASRASAMLTTPATWKELPAFVQAQFATP